MGIRLKCTYAARVCESEALSRPIVAYVFRRFVACHRAQRVVSLFILRSWFGWLRGGGLAGERNNHVKTFLLCSGGV